MTLAIDKMDGHGLTNRENHECLPKKTKVMQYQLQKDYLKDGALQLKIWVGECIAILIKEGQPSASQ